MQITDLVRNDPLFTILELYYRAVISRNDAKDAVLSQHQPEEEDTSSLFYLLKNYKSLGYNSPADPINFFRRFMTYAKPMDELERQFLLYFIYDYNGKLSMNAAAQELGLSGGAKFKRLLDKYGLEYMTEDKWKRVLHYVKQNPS